MHDEDKGSDNSYESVDDDEDGMGNDEMNEEEAYHETLKKL